MTTPDDDQQSEQSEQQETILSRGRGAVRRIGETVSDATGAFTGRVLEEAIGEYDALYTQVLVGLHGDFEHLREELKLLRELPEKQSEMSERIADIQSRLGQAFEQIGEIQSRLSDHNGRVAILEHADSGVAGELDGIRASIRSARLIAIGAAGVATAATIGVLWLAIG